MAVDLTGRHIVDGDWLEANLGDPELVILDSTVVLDPDTWHANRWTVRKECSHLSR